MTAPPLDGPSSPLSITPIPSPEEVAAIVAALRSRRADLVLPEAGSESSRWTTAGRLAAVTRWADDAPRHPWRTPPR